MSLYLKIMVKVMKLKKNKMCSTNLCDCSCDTDEDDYMIERLKDMRSNIDFMIRTLEHRKLKNKACQEILSYEDEDEDIDEYDDEYDEQYDDEKDIDVEKLIEIILPILKKSNYNDGKKTHHYIRYPFFNF